MRLEGGLELGGLCGLRHLGQGLQDLLLGVIDVLQRVEEQVVECLFSRRHGLPPVDCYLTAGSDRARRAADDKSIGVAFSSFLESLLSRRRNDAKRLDGNGEV
jgi:hypothetical protein